MMKKHFKKLVNLALTAVMVMGMSTTTFAKESNNISNDTVTKTNNIIYSPEFPDAYIVQIPLHRITDSASNGSVFPVVTEHFSASSDHAFL